MERLSEKPGFKLCFWFFHHLCIKKAVGIGTHHPLLSLISGNFGIGILHFYFSDRLWGEKQGYMLFCILKSNNALDIGMIPRFKILLSAMYGK